MGLELLAQRLEAVKRAGLYRALRRVDCAGATVQVEGRSALLLCSNNYLGLAGHPLLAQAAVEAAQQYGSSSGASRLVSGNLPLHQQLEDAVALWKGTETALLFNSGYAANTGIIAALADRGDCIFSDRLNHASIVDGALLSGARLLRYPHNDLQALERLLEKQQGSGLKLIVTDGVFSMDGDCAPLQQLAELASRHDALLMVDDAHAGGVLGRQGRGTVDLYGVSDKVAIQMGTFGKALGSFGAYAACSGLVRDYLINKARSLIFSTSLPPAVLGASLAAVQLVQTAAGEQLRKQVAENSAQLRQRLQHHGLQAPDGITPIIPLVIGSAEQTQEYSTRLLANGVFVQGIRPPTVPQGTSRLRCTLMACHSPEQVQFAADTIIRVGRELGVI